MVQAVQVQHLFLLTALLSCRRASSFITPLQQNYAAFSNTMASSSFFTATFRKAHIAAADSYMDALSAAATEALGRTVELEPTSGAGGSGGGGATTSAVADKATGDKYFVKVASGSFDMLKAEYLGVRAMAETNTIQVPTPIAFGKHESRSFVLFEFLNFCGGGSQFDLGVQLAQMHRSTSENHQFGFETDNTIGATHQPNLPWMDDWADFWDAHRLGHMLKLTESVGFSDAEVNKLRQITRTMLSQHKPVPSLLHGDLWGGNKAFCRKEGDKTVPVIFDPATYYGDREADVAMTGLFGGFGNDFYDGYNSEWPLSEGHEKRVDVYNLYHILNHEVLFGGYANQARGMIDQIL